jgi:hypothetical protein
MDWTVRPFRYGLENPERCPGGYTLDCYCDHENDAHPFKAFPHNFFNRDKRETFADARAAGWKFHRDGTATCPLCA